MTTPTIPPLLSTMMDVPLTVAGILERVRTLYAGREVVSLLSVPDEQGRPSPQLHRTSYGEVARRALQLAAALRTVGVGPGDRVATLAVNSYRHLEAYLGVPSMGAVLHTVNIRLHPDQVAWILNHAEDKVLLIEHLFAGMIPALRAACPGLETVVMLGTPATGLPEGVLDYDDWISGFSGEPDYPVLDERQAAAMCYTSGTTGNPKGVLYSHRSTVLHSLAAAPKNALNIGEPDVVLPVVPMFHVNAWGLPYTCAMTGAAQVFAGPFSDGPSLARLLEAERVSITAGVPTIWMGLLQELDRAQAEGKPYDLSCLESLVVGGSAAPEALLRAYRERHGLTLRHAWGMTETHPLGTVSVLPRGVDPGSDEGYRLGAKQGRTVPLVELKLLGDAGADGSGGEALPHDGRSMGRLLARGPWVTASYFKGEGDGNFVDIGGETWFDTGDIATLDELGYMHIQDRSKDLIKSGGEWISSVDLENALMAHPAVLQAAVIATPHPRWDERPLGVLVLRPGMEAPGHAELCEFLAPRFARWWLPDAYEVVASIPIGATGKFLKRELREQFAAARASVIADEP